MGIGDKPLLTVIIPIARMSGRLANLRMFLRTLDSSSVECLLIHDFQDEATSSELIKITSDLNPESLRLVEGYFGSPGYARNAGLEIARGEWVWFCDSDDLPILEVVLNRLSFYDATNNTYIFNFSYVNELDGTEIVNDKKQNLLSVAMNPGLWRVIFRKSQIEDLRFKNYLLGEDQEFMLSAIRNWNEVIFVPEVAYKYHYGGKNHLVDRRDRVQDLEAVLRNTLKFIPMSTSDCRQFSMWLGIRQLVTLLKIGNLKNRLNALAIFLSFSSRNPLVALRTLIKLPIFILDVVKK